MRENPLKPANDPLCCPACGISLEGMRYDAHWETNQCRLRRRSREAFEAARSRGFDYLLPFGVLSVDLQRIKILEYEVIRWPVSDSARDRWALTDYRFAVPSWVGAIWLAYDEGPHTSFDGMATAVRLLNGAESRIELSTVFALGGKRSARSWLAEYVMAELKKNRMERKTRQ